MLTLLHATLFTPECCDSKSVCLVSVHTPNTEAVDTDEKPFDEDNNVVNLRSIPLLLAHMQHRANHPCTPAMSRTSHVIAHTHVQGEAHARKQLWLIATIWAPQLISSVLHLIKGAVWGYYTVYIFICLPCNLINVVGPQVTGTLITGLRRRRFTPSETDVCTLSAVHKSVSENREAQELNPPSESGCFRFSS